MHSPKIADQKAYYDDRWGRFEYLNWYELSRLTEVLKEFLEIEFPSPPCICDLGCGPGWSTSILGMCGAATGFDLADTAIPAARYPHCRFVTGNILEWEPAPESFDAVVSLEVLEHIPYAEQAKFIGLAQRALKHGGHLLLTTPNAKTLRSMPQGGRAWTNQPVEDWLSGEELSSLLRKQGLVLQRLDSFVLGHGGAIGHRIANSVKLQSIMKSIGMLGLWQSFFKHRFYGLHLFAHAVKQ